MRITLAPVGTISDVLPMLALAKALHTRGHVVTLCAAEEFRSLIYKCGFPLFSNGKTYRNYLEGDSPGGDPAESLASILSKDMAMHFVALRDATRTAEALVASRVQVAAASMAEQLKIPYIYFESTPIASDYDHYPVFGVPQERINKRSKRLKEWDKLVLTALNRERKLSHLGPVQNLFEHLYRSGKILFPIDPSVVSSKVKTENVTGYCYFDDVLELDEGLTAFLNEGEAPVYIAPFRTKDAGQVSVLCDLLIKAGYRVILGNGWAPQQLPPGCIQSSWLSYAQIFPKMSVIVHGGLADITAHSIRARIPQVVAPYTAEQFYWAQRVSAIGSGPSPATYDDPQEILNSIEEARKMRERAHSVELAIANGAETAAILIEKITGQ